MSRLSDLIERAIATVAPRAAHERMQARVRMEWMQQGVQALADAGFGGHAPLRRHWAPRARDVNADTLRALPDLRAQSRELARVHAIAVGALRTKLDRVVGTGLALVAQPDRHVLGWTEEQAREWKLHTQREFSLWADSPDCDLTRAGNFYDRQRTVLEAMSVSGDVFTLLPEGEASLMQPYRLRLQLLEADRVGNPGGERDTDEVAGGIRVDGTGAPQAAYVYDRHPGSTWASGDRYRGQWVEFRGPSGRHRLLHHWRPSRPEQRRGIPWFAPIVSLLKDLDTYTDAEIKAAVVSAFFTVFIETDAGSPAPVFGVGGDDQAAGSDEIAMGPAAVVGLAKGEKASFANPNRPNTAFDPFVQAILQQIGMALGIPFELLLKRFNSSYSASKAALLDAWMFFRGCRVWLARSFCQPVYETWLAEAVASGRIEAPGFFADPLLRWAYCRAEWVGDSQGSIDPEKEVRAYTAAIEANLMTHERAEWELFGTDWNETTPTKIAERQRLNEAGLVPQPKPGAAAPQQPVTPRDDGGEGR